MKILNKLKFYWLIILVGLFLQTNVCFGGLFDTPMFIVLVPTKKDNILMIGEKLEKRLEKKLGGLKFPHILLYTHGVDIKPGYKPKIQAYPIMMHRSILHFPSIPKIEQQNILASTRLLDRWFIFYLDQFLPKLQMLNPEQFISLQESLTRIGPFYTTIPTPEEVEKINWKINFGSQNIPTENGKILTLYSHILRIPYQQVSQLTTVERSPDVSPVALFEQTLLATRALLNKENPECWEFVEALQQLSSEINFLKSLAKYSLYNCTVGVNIQGHIYKLQRKGQELYDRLKYKYEILNLHLPNAGIPLETAAPLPQILPPVSESAANAPITPSKSTLNHSKRRRRSRNSRNNRHMAPKPTTPVTTADETEPIPQTATPLSEAEPVLAPEDSVPTPTSASIPETAAAIDVPEAAEPLPQVSLQPDPYARALNNSDGLTDEDIKEWQTALRTHQEYIKQQAKIKEKLQKALADEAGIPIDKSKQPASKHWQQQLEKNQQTVDAFVIKHGTLELIAVKIANRKILLAAQRREKEKEERENLPLPTREIADMSPEEFDSRLQNSFPEAFRPLPTIPPIDNGLADHPPVIDAAAPPDLLPHLMPEESRIRDELTSTSESLETVD